MPREKPSLTKMENKDLKLEQILTLSIEEMVDIVAKSGCTDIQEAVALIQDNGFSVADLSENVLRSVIEVIASAESIGAQAGITKQ
jgi:hypothetical protein